jgi:three-Cys-motif partner protein
MTSGSRCTIICAATFAELSPMTTSVEEFFEEPLEQSRVKARIVSDYVITFCRILSDYQRSVGKSPMVDYIDLFSGPGSYGDGTASTPLLIIRAAIQDAKVAPALQTHFNDHDSVKADALKSEFKRLIGIDTLAHPPIVYNEEASVDFVERLHLKSETPKLYFLDPFGYKTLTMPLLRTVLEGWAECIFFFNYRRVIAALNNSVFKSHVERLFGTSRLATLKRDLSTENSAQAREAIVLKYLSAALVDAGAKHVMNFSFKVEDAHRSTHHLIFATRHRKGFEAMKTIMAGESSRVTEDGPSMTFSYRPAEPTLFDRDPNDVLAETLIEKFHSRSLTLDQIYEEFGPQTKFTQPYFRRALLILEERNLIIATPSATARPAPKGKQSMSGGTMVTFPEKRHEPDFNN